MNRYLISAAVLALLAAPAFAQPDGHDGHPGGNGGAPHAQAPHDAGPAMHGGPGGGAPRGGSRHDAPAMHAAPAAAPAAQPQAMRAQPPRGPVGGNAAANNRPDFNRGNNNARPDNNRPNVGRPDNRPGMGGPGNRPGNNARPGQRTDFSHFNDFHRSFNASRRFQAPAYRRPSGWSYQRWSFGQILPSLYWSQQYWLDDYNSYDLPPPPPGAVWVRYGDDALLIDRYSGEIITVEYGVFY